MTTETQELDGRCALALIAYLDRNDFTKIKQVTRTVFQAKDGSRNVFIWLHHNEGPEPEITQIPLELVKLAYIDGARLDVVYMAVNGNDAVLKHVMNLPTS